MSGTVGVDRDQRWCHLPLAIVNALLCLYQFGLHMSYTSLSHPLAWIVLLSVLRLCFITDQAETPRSAVLSGEALGCVMHEWT